ncbi:MAG: response regulator transcription factor [Sporichthyaceae bacterium]
MATILVCDGSPLIREQLRRSVGSVRGVDRVVTTATEDEALEHVRAQPPDLVLLDAGGGPRGGGGAGAVRRIRAADPSARVLMLTKPEDPDSSVVAAVAAGARGYLRKDASRAEVRVVVGQALIEPQSSGDGGAPGSEDRPVATLTDRELEVLSGMCEGQSNAEIGRALFLSEDTVKTHARRLFRKLGAADRAHAVAIALRRGLVR